MIGATQLVNSNLDPPPYDGQSAATAYISYDQIEDTNKAIVDVEIKERSTGLAVPKPKNFRCAN